jgi:[ribosomal protein S18]-alanine N-acetyltransferase
MTGKTGIIITEDPAHFGVCALMMSATDPWITLGLDYNQCLEAFEGAGKEVYIIKEGEEIEGFVILQVHGTFSGYIQTICIKESCRGKGLGKILLEFCEERVHRFSPNLFICVSSFNKGAIKLYLNYEFRLVGELNDFVKEGFTELLLRKTIGPRAGYKGK